MRYLKQLILIITILLVVTTRVAESNWTKELKPNSPPGSNRTHQELNFFEPKMRFKTLLNDDRTMEIDCTTAAATQSDMNQCVQRKARYLAQQLNHLLKELQQILGTDNEQWLQLKKVTEKWEQSKKQDCLWEKTFFGFGSVAPMVYHNCLAFHNVQRIDTLRRFLCQGYGMLQYCEIQK